MERAARRSMHPMRSRRRMGLVLGAAALLALAAAGCGTAAGAGHQAGGVPHATAAPASRWLTFNTSQHTATLTLIAGYHGANSGFNYDGYSHGQMVVSVPVGYTVTVKLTNQGSLPHSAAVVSGSPTSTTVAFAGASAPSQNISTGIAIGQSAHFHFTPKAPGTFYIVCLVPGHEQLGMWMKLVVSPGGRPSLRV